MKNKHALYSLLLTVVLTALLSGCATQLGFGFGFGSEGSSLSLGLRASLPREEKQDVWALQGFSLPQQEGERVTLTFPSGGNAKGRAWGSDLYAEQSNIGVAAVHSGLITFQEGGTVVVQREREIETYTGTNRNGVRSLDWRTKSPSFSFVNDTQ